VVESQSDAASQSNRDALKGLDDLGVAPFDAASCGMVMVDQQGQILLVNRQADEVFGLARAELIGESVEVLVPETSRSVHPRHRQGLTPTPQVRPMGAGLRLVGLRRGGAQFPVEIDLDPRVWRRISVGCSRSRGGVTGALLRSVSTPASTMRGVRSWSCRGRAGGTARYARRFRVAGGWATRAPPIGRRPSEAAGLGG